MLVNTMMRHISLAKNSDGIPVPTWAPTDGIIRGPNVNFVNEPALLNFGNDTNHHRGCAMKVKINPDVKINPEVKYGVRLINAQSNSTFNSMKRWRFQQPNISLLSITWM